MLKKTISNWGNYPTIESRIVQEEYREQIKNEICSADNIIARGNGKSYGDASLGEVVFSTKKLNKILDFDGESGTIECQSGVLLSEILELIVPKGYFLYVTPGTKLISVGGAIASDIHGKNHHKEGCFSAFLISFKLMVETGEILNCSKDENTELFWKTCGGMGLTGLILSAKFKLKPIESAYIKQRAIKCENLEETLKVFEQSMEYTYSVAWLDCLSKGKSLGKSIVMLGEHASMDDLTNKQKQKPFKIHKQAKLAIPFSFPGFVLNGLSVRAFNWLYYRKQLKKEVESVIHYDPYFYPLDVLNDWNKIYGNRGFVQYQFVLPLENGVTPLRDIIQKIAQSGMGSFLTVLKIFGPGIPEAPHSFPQEGYTLALDFKIVDKLFTLLDELDEIVAKHNGRIYLTKDARMSQDFCNTTYPNLKSGSKFVSSLSKRLNI